MKIIYSAILVNILFMAIVSGCLSSTTPSEKAKYVDVKNLKTAGSHSFTT
jgi:hypothetical protein